MNQNLVPSKTARLSNSIPIQFLEGLMLTSYAVRAHTAYIYFRGEFSQIARKFDERIAELTANGYLGDRLFGTDYSLRIHTHLGAGAYICGEETALLESLKAGLASRRLRPPFPAVAGCFGLTDGDQQRRNPDQHLRSSSTRVRIPSAKRAPKKARHEDFQPFRAVKKPGNYELPLGTTFRELILQAR